MLKLNIASPFNSKKCLVVIFFLIFSILLAIFELIPVSIISILSFLNNFFF